MGYNPLCNKRSKGLSTMLMSARFLALGFLLTSLALSGCGARGSAPAPSTSSEQPHFEYPFNANSSFADLKQQCDFGPRNPGSTGHEKCLAWMKAEVAKTADSVFTQSFKKTYGGKSITFTNVFAVYGKPASKWIILAAHWDTRPFADQDTDPAWAVKPIPGADDGASGVAVLTELGRVFKQRKPPVGVILAFLDGEDYGKDPSNMFLGARAFADNWKSVLKGVTNKIDYGILLDMVGAKHLSIPREGTSQQAGPKLMDKIYANARDAGLQKYFPDEMGEAIMDDHTPMNQKGIPTVDLISFDYAYWHTHEDTPDKCSPFSLQVVGEVVARTVYGEGK